MTQVRVQVGKFRQVIKTPLASEDLDALAKKVGITKEADLVFTIPEVENRIKIFMELLEELHKLEDSKRKIGSLKELPNAPKFQPCDDCHRPAKRVSKSMKTATYHCNVCDCDMIISFKR